MRRMLRMNDWFGVELLAFRDFTCSDGSVIRQDGCGWRLRRRANSCPVFPGHRKNRHTPSKGGGPGRANAPKSDECSSSRPQSVPPWGHPACRLGTGTIWNIPDYVESRLLHGAGCPGSPCRSVHRRQADAGQAPRQPDRPDPARGLLRGLRGDGRGVLPPHEPPQIGDDQRLVGGREHVFPGAPASLRRLPRHAALSDHAAARTSNAWCGRTRPP